jgi:hypothetical protein
MISAACARGRAMRASQIFQVVVAGFLNFIKESKHG